MAPTDVQSLENNLTQPRKKKDATHTNNDKLESEDRRHTTPTTQWKVPRKDEQAEEVE